MPRVAYKARNASADTAGILRIWQVVRVANSVDLIFTIERKTDRAIDPGVFVRYDGMNRDQGAALVFMRKALKRHSSPAAIVTDGLKSSRETMTDLGNVQKQEVGRHANNGWKTRTCRSDDESGGCSRSDE